MYNENAVSLIGRVGRTPESLEIGEGDKKTAKVNFTVATNRRWKDATGERREEVEWHNVVAYGTLAAFVAEYLNTGRLVRVLGRLKTRRWTKGAETFHRTEVVATLVSPLDPVPDGDLTEQPEEDDADQGQE